MERICLEQRELKSGPHLSWTILNLANLPIGKENVHWGFSRSWKFIHKRIKLGHQHAESKCCQGSQQKKNVHRTGQWIWWSIWSLQRAGKTEEIVGVETAPKRARKLGNNKENHCTDDYWLLWVFLFLWLSCFLSTFELLQSKEKARKFHKNRHFASGSC